MVPLVCQNVWRQKSQNKKLICVLFAVALTLTINITGASAVSFLGYTINITDTSEQTDFETIDYIKTGTVGIVNVTYNGSKLHALIQVNVSYSTNAYGPWSCNEELLPMQPIPKGNRTSTEYTFNKTGYYQLVIYVRVDQKYKVYNLPPIQTKSSQPDYNPTSIIAPCLMVGLVIGALGTSVMYVVNRKNAGFRL
jgi:hypothetical protein